MPHFFKMLGLYLVGQNCLHLTFEQYFSKAKPTPVNMRNCQI